MPYLVMKEQKSLWDSWLLGGVHAGTTVSPLLLEAGATVSKLVSIPLEQRMCIQK